MSNSGDTTIEELSRIDLHSLPEDGGPDFNRLVFEKSPYLLQHATNPIAWRPWSDQSLTLAREEDKPIFLSIGYSTCHWCHVMAHESFTDEHVAEILNQDYIPIKVDREERPDIDSTYMQACQVMTGSGGWPLTLIITPGMLPFFAATYIPKHDHHGGIGLISLLKRIRDLWKSDRDKINDSGDQVFAILKKAEQMTDTGESLDEETLKKASRDYEKQYDSLYSGFGTAPKFPAPHNLSLLLQIGQLHKSDEAIQMALDTLTTLRLGGIYDQLAGGIHRYSVDERWLVPHFEKMLYDQALLINAAIDGWLNSGNPFYESIATDTARYISRTLTSPEGGFYCGEDADSEGAEGTCYLWTTEEITTYFTTEKAAEVIRMFGMTKNGNFEGKNILHLPEGLNDKRLDEAREKLLPARAKRIQPHLDDKIITGWNGLTLGTLARLGAFTGEAEWTGLAEQAANFVREHLKDKDGRLLRRWRQQEAVIHAFLEDYAFLTWGLLELYQTQFKVEHLEWALQLSDEMIKLFSDGAGGLYDTGHDSEIILTRGRNLQDGAIPSGNGAAAMVLARIGLMTGRDDLCQKAETLLQNNASLINRHPTAFSISLSATHSLGKNAASLFITGDEKGQEELLKVARSCYRPGLEIIASRGNEDKLQQLAPIIRGKNAEQNQATAWLCQGKSCRPPATDPAQLARILAC